MCTLSKNETAVENGRIMLHLESINFHHRCSVQYIDLITHVKALMTKCEMKFSLLLLRIFSSFQPQVLCLTFYLLDFFMTQVPLGKLVLLLNPFIHIVI